MFKIIGVGSRSGWIRAFFRIQNFKKVVVGSEITHSGLTTLLLSISKLFYDNFLQKTMLCKRLQLGTCMMWSLLARVSPWRTTTSSIMVTVWKRSEIFSFDVEQQMLLQVRDILGPFVTLVALQRQIQPLLWRTPLDFAEPVGAEVF